MPRPSSAVSWPLLLPVLLGACVSQTTALEVTVPPTTAAPVVTSVVPVAPASTTAGTTTSTTTTSTTTTTSSTTTTSTTTPVTATTTVLAASLPPIADVGSAARSNGDATMPIDVRLPVFEHRPAAGDVAASWAAVVEDRFSVRARALIARRAAEAAEAAAAAAATTSTTTTTVPVPPPPPPRLTVTFELHPGAQGAALLRMVAVERLDGQPLTSTASFLVGADGAVVSSRRVVSSERFGDLAALIRSALGDRAGDWSGVSPSELLADVELRTDGTLVVRVAPSLLTPVGDAAVVEIAPDAAAPLLRPAGEVFVAAHAADCDVERCVALTFDDGPTPTTSRLLDVLDHARAPASFFVVGASVERHPDIARRIVAAGHDIGNHTWTHRSLTALSAEEIADELARTDAAIIAATGVRPVFLRPPYGRYDLESRYVEYGFAMWDVDPRDWDHRRPRATVRRSLSGVAAGSVVVLHDVHGTTVDAVPLLVAELRADGFTPATMSQMFGIPEAGAVYRSQTDVEPPPPSTTTTTTTTTTVPAS